MPSKNTTQKMQKAWPKFLGFGRTPPKCRQGIALCLSLALGLGLLFLSLNLAHTARASGPQDDPDQTNGPIHGLASNALTCLSSGDNLPGQASGVVHLTWQGRVERAQLVLSVAGTKAAHPIKVNGHVAALAPVHPAGQPCSDEAYFYLDIPPEVLVQGDNLVQITDDALPGDRWTAANVRIQVFGDLAIPPAGEADRAGQTGTADLPAAIATFIFPFTNPHDGSTQEAIAQIPDGYESTTPTPLLIAVHPRSSVMEWGIDEFGDAADARGWLLASPQMHGRWPIPEGCFEDPPRDCQYEDQVLAGTTSPTASPKPGAYAYASLESQYDVIGTVTYMVENYNVDPDRIYLTGYSMGGQGVIIIAAKFPHLFAAVFDNKGPTNMFEWYDEQAAYYGDPDTTFVRAMRKECYIVIEDTNTPAYPSSALGTPANPICYQRRSGVRFAGNYLHIPISMTHSTSDALVPIHHSRDLRDAINNFGPDQPASLFEDTTYDPDECPSGHCYEPEPAAVLDFLENFTLNNTPTHVNITTDESKSYYWMNLAQTGGDHWSQVEVTSYPLSTTVMATVSDTHPLTVAFNLGSTPITEIIPQPGMGLPATTYLVKGGSNNALHNYTSGYLTTTLPTTGQFTLTLSAIDAEITAGQPIVSAAQKATSTLTIVAGDGLDNPVPDGTTVTLTTTEGTFPNASSTYGATTVGGRATAIWTMGPEANPAEIVARVENVTATTSIEVIHPAIAVKITPTQTTILQGETITYVCQITNTGDATLTGVTLAVEAGPAGDSSDFPGCTDITLNPGATQSCSGSAVLTQTTLITATVTGRDPLSNQVAGSDSVTINVNVPPSFTLYVPVIVKNH